MLELSKLQRASGANLCLSCGKCSTQCPMAGEYGFMARRLLCQIETNFDDAVAHGLGRCLTCGACEVRCPQNVKMTEFVRGLREILGGSSQSPCPHGAVFQSAAGIATSTKGDRGRPAWLEDDLKVAEKGEIGLFVGCLPYFDAVFTENLGMSTLEIPRAAIRLMNRLGIEPVLVQDEVCCGHDQLWAGDRGGFERLAAANNEAFAKSGVQHIVSTCAECSRTWRLDYPDTGTDYKPKVQHISEFLAERVGEMAPVDSIPPEQTVTFQDPCRLSHHLEAAQAPRDVLAGLGGVSLEEMKNSGVDGSCCGTSGFTHCDATSKKIQRKRLEEAAATGAETLITACPKCLIHFACSRAEDRRLGRSLPSIELTDFTVYTEAKWPSSEDSEQELPAKAEEQMGVTR